MALSSGATIAFRGTAQLEVLDGGRVDITGPLVAGSSTGGDGSITVSGVNGALRSTIDATGDIRLALSSLGSMSIGAGALVHTAGNVSVAEFSTSNGTITIGGAAGGSSAELSADGDLFVGGGPNGNGGTGIVNVNADGQLSTAAVTVFTAGQLNVAGGGFASTGDATINGGAATVSGADGAGNVSTWNSSATISVGTNATGVAQCYGRRSSD